jgi:hypothetical protein
MFPVNIAHSVTIDCQITQNGWQLASLREMLLDRTHLKADTDLKFMVTSYSGDGQ